MDDDRGEPGAQRTALVDLWDHLHDAAVRTLLTDGQPDRAGDLVAEYRVQRATRCLLGLVRGGELLGAVGARMPYAGVCEVLDLVVAPPHRRAGYGSQLVQAAADRLHAVAVWADTAPDLAPFWLSSGFAVRPLADRPGLLRAERRNPPGPPGHRTTARVTASGKRGLAVELPPEGNTLPLVPASLGAAELPAHVAAWVLEAEEVGLLLQELAPALFPPVTPAVRPGSIRTALGPFAHVVGADPAVEELGPEERLPGLPPGVDVPVRIAELVAAAERIRAWLVAGHRVQRWVAGTGAAGAPWIVPAAWEPPDLT